MAKTAAEYQAAYRARQQEKRARERAEILGDIYTPDEITKLRQLQAHIEQAQQLAAELNASLRQRISHEKPTPEIAKMWIALSGKTVRVTLDAYQI